MAHRYFLLQDSDDVCACALRLICHTGIVSGCKTRPITRVVIACEQRKRICAHLPTRRRDGGHKKAVRQTKPSNILLSLQPHSVLSSYRTEMKTSWLGLSRHAQLSLFFISAHAAPPLTPQSSTQLSLVNANTTTAALQNITLLDGSTRVSVGPP